MQRSGRVDLVEYFTLLLYHDQDVLHRGCIHEISLDIFCTLQEADTECCPCTQISVNPEFMICSFSIFQAKLVEL
jgi:hypothetical protein